MDVIDRAMVQRLNTLFDTEVLTRVRMHFDAVEAERQREVTSEREAKALRLGATTDALRFDPMWYEPWKHLSAEMEATLAPYSLVIFPPQIRHIFDDSHLVPWHQDAGYIRLLGTRAHTRVLTCFVPLEWEPARCASLEFAHERHDLLEHVAMGDHGACIVDREFSNVEQMTVDFGGALAFNELALHRTFVPDGGTIERRSFEFRLVTREDAIPNKDYFDLTTRSFVKTNDQGVIVP